MDPEKAMAVAGLVLELAGVGIIWRFGWPQPQLEEGVGLGLEDATPYGRDGQTVAHYNRGVLDRRSRYRRNSSNGFLFLCLGFVLQIVAHLT